MDSPRRERISLGRRYVSCVPTAVNIPGLSIAQFPLMMDIPALVRRAGRNAFGLLISAFSWCVCVCARVCVCVCTQVVAALFCLLYADVASSGRDLGNLMVSNAKEKPGEIAPDQLKVLPTRRV